MSKPVTRLHSVDGVRGLVMSFMALDHAFWYLAQTADHQNEYWSGHLPIYSDTWVFVARLLSFLCAPVFFFLMGFSMKLLADSRSKARPHAGQNTAWNSTQTRKFFITRGALFIAIQFALENPLWSLAPSSSYAEMGPYFGVLFGLGTGMALGSFFIRARAWVLYALSGLVFTLTWLLVALYLGQPSAQAPLLLRLLFLSDTESVLSVFFPILPWFAFALLGMAFGTLFMKKPDWTFTLIGCTGVALLIIFGGVRFFTPVGNFLALPENPDWKAYLTLIKYPPSFLFTTFTLGVALTLLAVWQKFDPGRFGPNLFVTLGKAPFFFYLGHLALFSAFGLVVGKAGLASPFVYLAWIASMAILLKPTEAFSRFKGRQSPESFWRLF